MPADARWAAAAPRGSFERDTFESGATRVRLRFAIVESFGRGMTVTVTFIPLSARN